MISKEEIDKAISRLKSIDENTEEYDGNLFKSDFEIVLQYIEELETKLKKYELETIPQLQGEMDIIKKALNMQTIGWNEGARLYAEKQKLIEKLEEDIRKETGYAKWTNSYTKEISPAVTEMIRKSKYAQEILSMIKEREVK